MSSNKPMLLSRPFTRRCCESNEKEAHSPQNVLRQSGVLVSVTLVNDHEEEVETRHDRGGHVQVLLRNQQGQKQHDMKRSGS